MAALELGSVSLRFETAKCVFAWLEFFRLNGESDETVRWILPAPGEIL